MDTTTQGGYYVWNPPGQPVEIRLHLDVVDRLGPEIMRGFGAVPKRGAEVGGLLLGSIEYGESTIVRIDDFEPVDCQYKRGPSYILTDEDSEAFEETVRRWQPDSERAGYAVGYYRSDTREGGLSLSEDDVDLMDRLFPAHEYVALLVKPFVTKVSVAGFLVRQGGRFPQTSPLEFPLRRRELVSSAVESEEAEAPPERAAEPVFEDRSLPSFGVPEPGTDTQHGGRPKTRTGWVWMPLSFVFLLLGVLLGFQAASTMSSKATKNDGAEFALGLVAAKAGDNLTVSWNREALPVRLAQRGLLEIEDGGYSKPVDLDAAHLLGGTLIYRNSSNTVRFRLAVFLNSRSSVTETFEWRQ